MRPEKQAAYGALAEEEKVKIPSKMYTLTYQAQLEMLNRFCTQSLENSQQLDEILGGQPITVSSNRGKRQILTTIVAGLSLLLSGYNSYELQQISREVTQREKPTAPSEGRRRINNSGRPHTKTTGATKSRVKSNCI